MHTCLPTYLLTTYIQTYLVSVLFSYLPTYPLAQVSRHRIRRFCSADLAFPRTAAQEDGRVDLKEFKFSKCSPGGALVSSPKLEQQFVTRIGVEVRHMVHVPVTSSSSRFCYLSVLTCSSVMLALSSNLAFRIVFLCHVYFFTIAFFNILC